MVTVYSRFNADTGQISIHTTRVGGDPNAFDNVVVIVFISIHTTRVGGDTFTFSTVKWFIISIHTTRVGGDQALQLWDTSYIISIHTTRVGGDVKHHQRIHDFQISIHTTRVGGDPLNMDSKLKTKGISIHTTRVGGDLSWLFLVLFEAEFQSTPPVWVVTGCTPKDIQRWFKFQSTPPVWVVTITIYITITCFFISIHTTRVGGDSARNDKMVLESAISIHTTRVGGDIDLP